MLPRLAILQRGVKWHHFSPSWQIVSMCIFGEFNFLVWHSALDFLDWLRSVWTSTQIWLICLNCNKCTIKHKNLSKIAIIPIAASKILKTKVYCWWCPHIHKTSWHEWPLSSWHEWPLPTVFSYTSKLMVEYTLPLKPFPSIFVILLPPLPYQETSSLDLNINQLNKMPVCNCIV